MHTPADGHRLAVALEVLAAFVAANALFAKRRTPKLTDGLTARVRADMFEKEFVGWVSRRRARKLVALMNDTLVELGGDLRSGLRVCDIVDPADANSPADFWLKVSFAKGNHYWVAVNIKSTADFGKQIFFAHANRVHGRLLCGLDGNLDDTSRHLRVPRVDAAGVAHAGHVATPYMVLACRHTPARWLSDSRGVDMSAIDASHVVWRSGPTRDMVPARAHEAMHRGPLAVSYAHAAVAAHTHHVSTNLEEMVSRLGPSGALQAAVTAGVRLGELAVDTELLDALSTLARRLSPRPSLRVA